MYIPDYVKEMLHTLKEAGYAAYLVGGCVRDHFLGVRPKDYDLATSAPPEVLLSLFAHTVPTGLKHGTVTVVTPEGTCEVTTFRTDAPYIEADLARRDFTINALAYDGEHVVDPFQGRKDLERNIIRAVGEPSERFLEDGLRLLRAVRFAAQFKFSIEAKTKAAIKDHAHLLGVISVERIRDELSKLLLSQDPANGVQLMHQLDLLPYVLPELELGTEQSSDLSKRLTLLDLLPAHLVLRLAALFIALDSNRKASRSRTVEADHRLLLPKQALKRLTYARKTIEQVSVLLSELEREWSSTDHVELKQCIQRLGLTNVELLFQLQSALAQVCQEHEHICPDHRFHRNLSTQEIKMIWARVDQMIQEKPPLFIHDLAISGNDLRHLGVEEGPQIGQLLQALLARVLADEHLNRRDILLRLAKEMIEPIDQR